MIFQLEGKQDSLLLLFLLLLVLNSKFEYILNLPNSKFVQLIVINFIGRIYFPNRISIQ